MNKRPWVHFVAICGPTVAAIAVLYQKKGWKVTGSDANYYPPASTYLQKNKIEIINGFDSKNIKKGIDLVILGGGALIMDRNNPEVARAKELGIRVTSWPKIAGEVIAKIDSVVVAGTYGKTTTTSMIAWILKDQKKDPSYLIGGYANNFSDNVYMGNGSVSVMEGDEHPSALYFDQKSKFLYYKPKYVLITSAKWDHFNVFPKEKDYIETYIKLVGLLPKDGLLLLSRTGENLKEIAKYADCKVLWYSDKDFEGQLPIIGRFNRENAAGAMKMSMLLGIKKEDIMKSLSKFSGVKRRLEKRFENKRIMLVEDFAQHPYKVKEVLKTLKENYPNKKLTLVFDPSASILRTSDSLRFYKNSFSLADQVFVRRLKLAVDKNKRVTGPEVVKAIGNNASYVPMDEVLVDKLDLNSGEKDHIILFCSSGAWNGLIEKVKNRLS